MEPDNDSIRQRAHEIWEAEGFPEGRDAEHWQQARTELMEETTDEDAPLSAGDTDAADSLEPTSSTARKSELNGTSV